MTVRQSDLDSGWVRGSFAADATGARKGKPSNTSAAVAAVAASTKNTHEIPPIAITGPATSGPSIAVERSAATISELPSTSVPGSMTSGRRASRAGIPNMKAKPTNRARSWTCRSEVVAGINLPMLVKLAKEVNSSYRRVAIRRQRTRWGSCSVRGTISLNCCLLFQRPAVVRYLLIHELAHTVHMNHSHRFWRFVALHCRDYRKLDKELLDGWRRVPSWAMSV